MNRTELDSYRQRLLDLRERLRNEAAIGVELIRETVRKPGENTALPTHNADQDTEGLDTEVEVQGNERQVLEAVEQAIDRIEDGSYGWCQTCGRPIARERLELLPYTPYCAVCAHRHEEQQVTR